MKRTVFFVTILFITLSLNAQKILFVGNSLTYYNNLPKILELVAKEYGVDIKTESLCYPNYALIDHLEDGLLQQYLVKNQYDYVIIQQGPSSQEKGKKMLLRDGAVIKSLCEKQKSQLGYFMVWPSKQYYFTFDKVIENHQLAAKSTKSLLFPVGLVWKEYNELKRKESLYGPDGFHPSSAGSFLAALVIFHQIEPKKNLHQLTINNLKKWIKNEGTLKEIIQLVEKH